MSYPPIPGKIYIKKNINIVIDHYKNGYYIIDVHFKEKKGKKQ